MFVNYAHRGASKYYPENTLSSFYAGLHMGANGIETDVQRTKDGVLVLFHDDTLERIANINGTVSDLSYEQLSSYPVYNTEYDRRDRITTLEDFLKYFSGYELTFAVELKQDKIEKDVIDMLERFNMREKTILTSFSYENIKNAKLYNPAYRVGLLYGAAETQPVEKLRAIGGEELCPKAELLQREDVERYHSMGFSVRSWGVSTPEIMERMYSIGVDGMTVDFPDLLAEHIRNLSCTG